VLGQFELGKYKSGCKQLVNANPLIQGPVSKRKGSYYTANAKSNGKFWLFEFVYDRFDAYVIEAGNNYFRFYRNRSQVLSSGTPYELATPYTLTMLTNQNDGTFNLRFVQSNDVIYVCTNDGSLPAYTLNRYSDTNWTLVPFAAVGGPFQPQNNGTTTVYASAQTGTVTLTASAALFTSDHVGMLFQISPQTLEYTPSWEPGKQQFLGQRVRANGNTYIATAPTPAGTPQLPLGLVTALTGACYAGNLVNVSGTSYTSAQITTIQNAFYALGGTSAEWIASGNALVISGAIWQDITNGLQALIGTWSGASAGLYTGTVQPTHDDGTVFDGSGSCPNPYGSSPATVACGVPWLFEDPGYGIVLITSVTDSTHAVGTVQPFREGLVNTPALPYYVTQAGLQTALWAFGAWGTAAGASNQTNPAFYRDRLCFGAANSFAASVSQSYNEFYTTVGGQTLADNAISIAIEEQGALISWMVPLDALSIGTAGGELTAYEQNISNAFGPTNIKVAPQTNYGSHGCMPVRIGNAIFFVDATGIVLRKMENTQQSAWSGQNTSPSQVDLAEHILKPGCIQLKYAPLPFPAILAPRSDGVLARFAYDKDENVFAWSRYVMGGYQDAARNTYAKVLCSATVPSPDGKSTDIYMGVERLINGAISRTIEIIRDQPSAPKRQLGEAKDSWLRRLNDWQCDQFRVDCGLSYDSPVTVTGMSAANPITVTAPAHGFTNGSYVRFDGITSTYLLNARKFQIAGVTTNTFTIAYDGTTLPPFAGVLTDPAGDGPVVRQYVSSVSGLTHIVGETVAVCVDGTAHPSCVVSVGGSITLNYPGCRVHVGEAYPMLIDILAPPAPGQFGATEGQTQQVQYILARFDNTLGGWFGPDVDNLTAINFRRVSDPLGLATPAYTGIKKVDFNGDWSEERNLVFMHTDPLPCTMCAMGYMIEANEDSAP
jgi:hypothetical protein